MSQTVAASNDYPVIYEIEYPQRQSRWLTFFRGFLIIPVLLVVSSMHLINMLYLAASTCAWVSLMSNRRYPSLIFPWMVWWNRLLTQMSAYFQLLTDDFPLDERDSPLIYEIEYTFPHRRWTVFFRFILIIPHIIIVAILGLLKLVVTWIAWFAILIIGKYPRPLWDFSVAVERWNARVSAYAWLFTDRYPPFSFT